MLLLFMLLLFVMTLFFSHLAESATAFSCNIWHIGAEERVSWTQVAEENLH